MAAKSLGITGGTVNHWLFYKVGKGKNASDWLGAMGKLAYLSSVAKNRDWSVRIIPQIIEAIRNNMGEHFKKIDSIQVEEVEKFDRPAMKEAQKKAIPVKGIQKLHHLSVTPAGLIYGRPLAFMDCLALQATVQSVHPSKKSTDFCAKFCATSN